MGARGPSISAERFQAVIFDVDGVITDTAELHFRAWKEIFDRELEDRATDEGPGPEPFSRSDYLEYVDGRPRYDGVRAFLASRGIHLPEGSPDDPPERDTVCGLGNRKNGRFLELLGAGAVPAYPSTVALVEQLHGAGLRTAAISASRNARGVLGAAGVLEAFEVIVDGVVADEEDLPGKPDPAVFVEAAHRLGVRPDRAVVVEDAQSGVAAGRRGGFGLVIGVDRVGQREALLERGADVVVGDLSEVVVTRSGTGGATP